MKKIVMLFAAVFVFMGLQADTKTDVVDLVDKAIAFYNTNGLEKTVAEIHKKDGLFIKGDIYLFINDDKGETKAHGGNPKLVGKQMIDLKDTDGKFFIKEFTEVAKKGSGWVDYKWSNPETKTIQAKTTYIKRIPKTQMYIGCGIYKK